MPAPLSSGIRRVLLNQSSAASAVPCPIDADDPNTQLWIKADSYIDPASLHLGDKLNITVNKTSDVAPNYNLKYIGAPAHFAGWPRQDNKANLLAYSENMAAGGVWQGSNAVAVDADTARFTAQNGVFYQYCPWLENGVDYRFSVWLQNVSGNTNLRIFAQGSSNPFDPITIDGTLREYTIDFTGAATYVGVSDPNAAGWGDINMTKARLWRLSDQDGTYMTTGSYAEYGTRNGIPVIGATNTGPSTHSIFGSQANRTLAHPFTVYMSVYIRKSGAGWFLTCNAPTLLSYIFGLDTGGPPNPRQAFYLNGNWRYGTQTALYNQWQIWTFVANGANSEIRLNKYSSDIVNHPAATPNVDKWQLGGDSYAGVGCEVDFHEVITRYTVDNTATQNLFIDYMADQVGLTL